MFDKCDIVDSPDHNIIEINVNLQLGLTEVNTKRTKDGGNT